MCYTGTPCCWQVSHAKGPEVGRAQGPSWSETCRSPVPVGQPCTDQCAEHKDVARGHSLGAHPGQPHELGVVGQARSQAQLEDKGKEGEARGCPKQKCASYLQEGDDCILLHLTGQVPQGREGKGTR